MNGWVAEVLTGSDSAAAAHGGEWGRGDGEHAQRAYGGDQHRQENARHGEWRGWEWRGVECSGWMWRCDREWWWR